MLRDELKALKGTLSIPIVYVTHDISEALFLGDDILLVAPGMVIGGFMVDLALRHVPEGAFFDAMCETPSCRLDAIQLLTPCTVGNGWLKILTLGRYALILYEKRQWAGIRVFLDASKVDAWPEIKGWYFRLKPKKDQNSGLLFEQIRQAGESICTLQKVVMKPQFVESRDHGNKIIRCLLCQKVYPENDGEVCRGCSGHAPYQDPMLEDKPAGKNPLP